MNLGILTILEVAPKIKKKDFEATKRWIESKGIPKLEFLT